MSLRRWASPSARTAIFPAMMPPGPGHQFLHGMEGLAGGNNVVNDEHALSADKLRVCGVDHQLLDAHGGNGLHRDLKHAGHICLGSLGGQKVLVGPALGGPSHTAEGLPWLPGQ